MTDGEKILLLGKLLRLQHIEGQTGKMGSGISDRCQAKIHELNQAKGKKNKKALTDEVVRLMHADFRLRARLNRIRAKMVLLANELGTIGFIESDDSDTDNLIAKVVAMKKEDNDEPEEEEEDVPEVKKPEADLNLSDEDAKWLKEIGWDK